MSESKFRLIAVGDVFNGMQFFGPYTESTDELAEFANDEFNDSTWWIVDIVGVTPEMESLAEAECATFLQGNFANGFVASGIYAPRSSGETLDSFVQVCETLTNSNMQAVIIELQCLKLANG